MYSGSYLDLRFLALHTSNIEHGGLASLVRQLLNRKLGKVEKLLYIFAPLRTPGAWGEIQALFELIFPFLLNRQRLAYPCVQLGNWKFKSKTENLRGGRLSFCFTNSGPVLQNSPKKLLRWSYRSESQPRF